MTEQDLSRLEPTDEVTTLREAMNSPDWPIWEASIKKELDGLGNEELGQKSKDQKSPMDARFYLHT